MSIYRLLDKWVAPAISMKWPKLKLNQVENKTVIEIIIGYGCLIKANENQCFRPSPINKLLEVKF